MDDPAMPVADYFIRADLCPSVAKNQEGAVKAKYGLRTPAV